MPSTFKQITVIKRFCQLGCIKQYLPLRQLSSTAVLKSKDDDFKEVEPPESPTKHPFRRTFNILKHDLKSVVDRNQPPLLEFSQHVDICIIGGGVIGSSIAYWIKQRIPRKSLSILVIEKDPGYTRSATVLSVGGLRQQFSLKENIEMSIFGAEFLRKAPQLLAVEDSPPPDMKFHPHGCLMLATQSGAAQLNENWLLQTELGVKSELLSQQKLKDKFPWINVDDIEVACHGLENEGWFDPWALLYALKRKAIYLGVEYVTAEVVGFEFRETDHNMVAGVDPGDTTSIVDKVIVKTPTGEIKSIKFATTVLAGGYESGKIAEMARIGRGQKMLSVPLPVEPRKRYVYCFNAPEGPGLDFPLIIDPSGAYVRREGLVGHFVGGQAPPLSDEPNVENLEVDYSYFDNVVWPNLSHRIPSFENVKIQSAWAGYYDYNSFDQNAILGPHPYYNNFYFACGFSGHGIQHAPAVGRAIMEMILDGEFRTINLSRFHFERFLVGQEVKEINVA